MPYYQNGSVKDLITGRHMTVREVIGLATQVLAGLHNIHSKNLVHFDVKPDNILLSPRREALVSDFGQAKQMNYSGIAAQNRHYTPMIPPEALVTDHFDRTFDIYQLGLTLYRMCNGNEHFYSQLATYGNPTNFDRELVQVRCQKRAVPRPEILRASYPVNFKECHQEVPAGESCGSISIRSGGSERYGRDRW